MEIAENITWTEELERLDVLLSQGQFELLDVYKRQELISFGTVKIIKCHFFLHSFLLSFSAKTVSYTHLDVYKRQPV